MGDVDRQLGREGASPLPPGLYLLSTPIGSARDITLRGLDALAGADLLAAEDTRVLRRLMDIHGVGLGGRPLISYHDHNAASALPKVLTALDQAKRVVYASDAGTPLLADPGFRLAREARRAGHAVWSLPGPSALLAGLVVSGLPTDAFVFLGFPPAKSGARRRFLESWAAAPGTLVAYETGARLAACLDDMAAVLGDRPAALARELTKRHEQVVQGRLSELAETVRRDGPPRGEIVLLIDRPAAEDADPAQIEALLRAELARQSLRDAVRTVSERLLVGRKLVYDMAVRVKADRAAAGDDVFVDDGRVDDVGGDDIRGDDIRGDDIRGDGQNGGQEHEHGDHHGAPDRDGAADRGVRDAPLDRARDP